MMRFTVCTSLLLLLAFSTAGFGSPSTLGDISVSLSGFRNNHGKAMVVLYDSADGYPGSYEKAVAIASSVISDGKAEVVFSDIRYGDYAIEVLHDEDMDGQMATNWLKMPKEGYGFSNNAKGLVGPPSFEKAKFRVNSETLMMTLNMDYL